ncbi:hypothetical protein BU26DRAFT_550202 [Trematosphaeria pertusa]|uniref:Uncharacterized protein n=1 Tax=Trematosphaeria pertusa TaxID=390896 RepID=A0A6A6IHQ5_9PLEO|nr:uncharacterized protein BU26DRAFT_550202 [Trematosphaeria pertusa]KAF2249886.1 hypothetical protein BU26DRAFT_550202 [Trematosphaeria pertusa]
MDGLPEEIVDAIIRSIDTRRKPYLTRPDSRTFHSLCLASRRLYRIAKPHLYVSIHSTSGTMGRQLLRTLSANRHLAECVENFAVQHSAEGCFQTITKYSIEQDEWYGRVEDQCGPLLLSTIRLLPNLKVLDLSRFPPKQSDPVWLHPRLDQEGNRIGRALDASQFSVVHHLSLHLGSLSGSELWPVFRLPSLRSLEVDMREPGMTWSDVKSLSIIGFSAWRADDVKRMCLACVALRSLFVTTSDLATTHYIPKTCRSHIRGERLKSIRVAVEGLWHYDVDVGPYRVDDEVVGKELVNVLSYVTGDHGADGSRVEASSGCDMVRSVTLRELSPDEKRAYDSRLVRRP